MRFYRKEVVAIQHPIGAGKVYVDQSAQLEFNINPYGHISSQMDALLRVEDDMQKQKLLQAIASNASAERVDRNKGKSVDDIIREVIPKTVQEPSEIQRYYEYAEQYGLLDHLVPKQQKNEETKSDESIKFDAGDAPSSAGE